MSSTVGNILWITFGIESAEYSVVALFSIYMIINMVGARRNHVDKKTITNIIYDKFKHIKVRLSEWSKKQINGFKAWQNPLKSITQKVH